MKKELILMAFANMFVILVFAQHPSQDKNWEVIFWDDFTSFDTVLWHKTHNGIHGNYNYFDTTKRYEEPQVYIQDNAYIENERLVLKTIRQSYPCPKGSGSLHCQYGGTHSYTSGQIISNATYKYGYYEIYAKLPASSGYWPAFWFWNNTPDTQISNCWYNEIDVFEASGCNLNVVESRAHWGFQCPTGINNQLNPMPHTCNYSTGYHWYGVKWTGSKISWYIDGQIVRQTANNMEGIGIQNPMYIIINVALKPNGGECDISANSIFPNYMYVDQANAYHLKCDKNTVVNEISNYNTFYYAVKKSISLSSASSLSLGQNISLKATDFIELKSGFEVPLGAELYLDVTLCE